MDDIGKKKLWEEYKRKKEARLAELDKLKRKRVISTLINMANLMHSPPKSDELISFNKLRKESDLKLSDLDLSRDHTLIQYLNRDTKDN
jgi:hypothetical protein